MDGKVGVLGLGAPAVLEDGLHRRQRCVLEELAERAPRLGLGM